MYRVPIKFKKIDKDAVQPEYKTEGAAAFDLFTDAKYIISPKTTEVVGTGIKVEVPEGFEMQIRPRSGKSLKSKMRIANSPGTIDSDYRGEVGILAENTGDQPMTIEKNERIAQGIIKEVPKADFIEVEKLEEHDRDGGGFGLSGDK